MSELPREEGAGESRTKGERAGGECRAGTHSSGLFRNSHLYPSGNEKSLRSSKKGR